MPARPPPTPSVDRREIESDKLLIARGGLLAFARLAWHVIESGTDFLGNWHLEEVCDALERQARGEEDWRQIVVAEPPGCSKTILISVMRPAYVWGPCDWPGARFICATYDRDLAEQVGGQKFRDLVSSAWYQARWPMRLRGKSVGYVRNQFGGWRNAVGVNGSVTGKHADFLDLDDPLKAQDAHAGGEIKHRAYRFHAAVLGNRCRDPKTTRRTIYGQRLAPDDVQGQIAMSEEAPRYRWLTYPMIGPPASPTPRDRRKPDELLWPSRWPAEEVDRQRIALGPEDFAAQFQQDPTPPGGVIYRAEWFRYWTQLPQGGPQTWIFAADYAFKDHAKADHYVIQLWLRAGGAYYLVDQSRGRQDFVGVQRAAILLALRHPEARRFVYEDRGNGPAVQQQLSTMLATANWASYAEHVLHLRPVPPAPRLLFEPVTPKSSKLARAQATTGLWEAGLVYLPGLPMPWVRDYERELLAFTGSTARQAQDDQVDATSLALGELAGGAQIYVLPAPTATTFRPAVVR